MIPLLAAVFAANVGCRRGHTPVADDRAAPPPPAEITSPEEPIGEDAANATASTAPRLRPEQERARRAHAARAEGRARPPSGRQAIRHDASVPETADEAQSLMSRINADIAARNLDPKTASHFRASFRGRLLSAGISKEAIESWIAAE